MYGFGESCMTRQDLEQAVCDLEYLVINHFDFRKVNEYAEQLRLYREELRALEAAERYAAKTTADRHVANANG
jgi:hypothetical protein